MQEQEQLLRPVTIVWGLSPKMQENDSLATQALHASSHLYRHWRPINETAVEEVPYVKNAMSRNRNAMTRLNRACNPVLANKSPNADSF